MKSFSIVYNYDKFRCFAYINSPFSIDINELSGLLMFSITEMETDYCLEMEIPIELEDNIKTQLLGNNELKKNLIDKTYDEAQRLLIDFLSTDNELLDGDLFVTMLSIHVSSLGRLSVNTTNFSEKKNKVETISSEQPN